MSHFATKYENINSTSSLSLPPSLSFFLSHYCFLRLWSPDAVISCSCWLLPCNVLVSVFIHLHRMLISVSCRLRWKSLQNVHASPRRSQHPAHLRKWKESNWQALFLFLQTVRPKSARRWAHLVPSATRRTAMPIAQLGAATIGHVRFLRRFGKRCYP